MWRIKWEAIPNDAVIDATGKSRNKYESLLIKNPNLKNLFFKIFLHVYLFLRERRTVRVAEGQREKETQNPKQAPGFKLSAQSPTRGLELTKREIMTWAEVGRLTNWATQVPPNLKSLIENFYNTQRNYPKIKMKYK